MEFKLDAKLRNDFGKEKVKKLRADNKMPAVIYGKDRETESLLIDYHDFSVIENKMGLRQPLIHLTIVDHGKTEKVLPKKIQFHPVTKDILHVDFYRVPEGEKVVVPVPVRSQGNAYGVIRQGGSLAQKEFTLNIRCDIDNIPDYIDVDVTELRAAKTIYTEELSFDEFEIANPPRTPIFSVRVKGMMEEEEEAAEEEGGEAAPAAE